MTEFTRTQPAGRMIARLFARAGWAIVAAGVVLAGLAALLGRVPGFDGAGDDVSTLSRLLAALPGLGLALFGLFSVMMAALTRAAIDSADIAREMLVLARRRPISLLAAIPPLGEEENPAPRRAAPQRDEAAPDSPPAAPPIAGSRGSEAEARREGRAEPVFASSARPKSAPGKVRPIFSARPPR